MTHLAVADSHRSVRTAAVTLLSLTVVSTILLGGVAAALTSRAVTAGAYSGTTSEHQPVTFTVAANRKSVRNFTSEVGYNGKCGQGGGPGFEFDIASMTLTAANTFTATVVAADNAVKSTLQISGKISGKSATGTILAPKPYFTCSAPNQKVNPYSATFTAKG
jgi:hypothetical protein